MKAMPQLFLALLVALLALAQPASAQLPDPVRYGVRTEAGDIDQVRQWLDAGLPPDFLADRIGTGLMIAAWNGDLALMELFLARGADVNKTNAAGEQALLHAAWRGNSAAVDWLLAHGAQIKRQPLQWTALHYAVFAGRAELAQQLIGRGADINARSTNGSSVLMMAAYEGHEALARQLLDKGADPGIRNERGETALDWAMRHQHLGIARLVSQPQQFAVAASKPKAHWGEPQRSQRESPEVELLLSVRTALVERGMSQGVEQLDRQISAARAGPELRRRPAAILEISASRNAPRRQSARLVNQGAAP